MVSCMHGLDFVFSPHVLSHSEEAMCYTARGLGYVATRRGNQTAVRILLCSDKWISE